MEKKRSLGEKAEAFFAGKGFYIVLFLCVAVIGVSAWAMLSGTGTDVDDVQDFNSVMQANEPEYIAPVMDPSGSDTTDTSTTPDLSSDATAPENDTETQTTETGELNDDTANTSDAESSTENTESGEPSNTETAAWTDEDAVSAQPTYTWPIHGEIEVPFSVASLIYNKTMGDWRTHEGVDLTAEVGTPVMAASSGRVENVYTDDFYGVTVVIDHMGGLKSLYSNLAETPTVAVGDSVSTGEIIGSIGTSALAESGEVAHLHFGMTLDGVAIDPQNYLPPR